MREIAKVTPYRDSELSGGLDMASVAQSSQAPQAKAPEGIFVQKAAIARPLRASFRNSDWWLNVDYAEHIDIASGAACLAKLRAAS
tara:strand:+ start:10463 stop:10720 length:258 start_codon:yes stop_codon:yes gene_type:complete